MNGIELLVDLQAQHDETTARAGELRDQIERLTATLAETEARLADLLTTRNVIAQRIPSGIEPDPPTTYQAIVNAFNQHPDQVFRARELHELLGMPTDEATDVTREFGTALGVALLGAMVSAGYRGTIDARLDGVPQGVADTAREGLANAVEAAGGAGSHGRALIRAAQESFVDGWQQAMWAGVVVMAVLRFCVLARGPKDTRTETPGKDDDSLRGITERSPEGSFPSA